MAEYRFHWWPSGTEPTPSVSLQAESHLHGAALALRYFLQLGCDLTSPLAHVDMSEADGVRHPLLVEEVREWLHDPKQTVFVQREDLGMLLS